MGAAHPLGQLTIEVAIYFLKFDSCSGLLDITWIDYASRKEGIDCCSIVFLTET